MTAPLPASRPAEIIPRPPVLSAPWCVACGQHYADRAGGTCPLCPPVVPAPTVDRLADVRDRISDVAVAS